MIVSEALGRREGLARSAAAPLPGLAVALETTFLPGDPPVATTVDRRERQLWRAQGERAVSRLAGAAAQAPIDLWTR